ncbi:MAG TPA: competence protein ComJ [Thermogutta sp.]|nr:competence protein ComJ [Thermogutta sp.]
MTTTSMAITVSYSQIAVFSSHLENPFNNWQEHHVTQGFSWREHSVSFRTLNEFGSCSIEIDFSECHPGSDDAIRAIRVPFSVPEDGKIEIGSIGDSVPLSIAPGAYALLFQILAVRPDGKEVIRLSFSKSEPMDFAIIKADEQITISGPLCKTSQAAT